MSPTRKRKQRSIHRRREENHKPEISREFNSALFVVAHEADIVRGPQAELIAKSLEVVEYSSGQPPRKRIGDALVKWGAHADSVRRVFPEEDSYTGENQDPHEEMWMDRYDARLLLDTLPPIQSTPAPPRAESPGGWSDLPSDSEDTFFLSPSEVEHYWRQKRRRTLDKAYEERLKARIAEDEDDMEEQDAWGGSDEEPDDIQKDLMRRTAVHLHSSPNPAQLEMRILANHGADKRFAFLRGRWSRTWKIMKSKVRMKAEEYAKETARKDETSSSHSLGALAGYGDSDEDGSNDGDDGDEAKQVTSADDDSHAPTNEGVLSNVTTNDASTKEARRARAKVWAEIRRASRVSSSSND